MTRPTDREPKRVGIDTGELKMDKSRDIADLKPDVVFVPKFLTQPEADELLARIQTTADFRQNYIQLYGRKAIPRLEAWYGSWDYPYSKGVVLKAAPMPLTER